MEDFIWELKTERFLNGEMTAEELLTFEQEQAENPELQAYVTLSMELQQALSEDDWFHHKNTNSHYNTVKNWYQEEDVLNFKEQIEQHADAAFAPQKKTFSLQKYWLPIAAAFVAIFITIIYQFTAQPDLKELYTTYATWNDTPSFLVQDEHTATTKEQIEILYKNQQYAECIAAADSFLNTATTGKTNVLIYKGFAQEKLNKNSKALATFKTISESNALDASKGLWYMALIYLKTEDTENLQKTLKVITASETNYEYENAVQLLNSIE
ncbi:hypothetical protein [uncultured Kordia sp.]|uniref:tetratricopeptide repeat protein n=1 Tax=uncultured Kordia sp. TaxID=507699 RepID=UPI0026018019|nr:hypothetical protein [uncultured Kordia sp.]